MFLRFDVTALLAEALHPIEQRLVHFDVFDLGREDGQVPLYHSGSGDELKVTSTLLEIKPSRSRPDRGMVLVQSITTNQRDEVLQKLTSKVLCFRK